MDGANIPGFDQLHAGQPRSFGLATNPADMNRIRTTGLLAALAAVAPLVALAGCGSDSSGETSTSANADAQTSVSIPSPTSPIPTTTTTSTTGGGKQKPAQTTTSATGGSAVPCTIPVAYEDFKFTGLDCTAALAVASAWDQNGKICNTVDNPDSPIGPQRTCTVENFTCRAVRDRTSDARFVNCTQGGQSIRFTWLPA
jgi:hypothetical protein